MTGWSAAAPISRLTLRTLLRLGRVSNLPTVWTNVLAGTVLGGGTLAAWSTGLVLAGTSACYVGGMYLNDAFDAVQDRLERPGRPIPAGDIDARTVSTIGATLLAIGVVLLSAARPIAGAAGLLLAASIVLYDLRHKHNPFSPLVMAACRSLVLVTAGLAATGRSTWPLALGATLVAAHVAGLTYVAKQEAADRLGRPWPLLLMGVAPAGVLVLAWRQETWLATLAPWLVMAAVLGAALRALLVRPAPGAVPRAVSAMIAVLSLLDGALVAAAHGAPILVLACGAAWLLTRRAQAFIPGT